MDSVKIGFAGTGIMGRAMALNLRKAGLPVMVYNRTPDKIKPLVAAGALTAALPSGLAAWAQTAVLMLTGPEAVDEVLFGEDGMLAAPGTIQTLINMSTVPPSYTRDLCRELEAKNVRFIDAPVSGSTRAAEEGALVILAAGDPALIKAHEAIFSAMGKKVIHCGEAGQGSSMKIAVNLLLALMMEGFAEAANFAEKSGLPIESFLDAVGSGALNCPLFSLKTEMLIRKDYSPQFPLKHALKDLRFALGSADQTGAAIPGGHTVYQLYRQAAGKGLGDLDFAAVKKVLESLSDV